MQMVMKITGYGINAHYICTFLFILNLQIFATVTATCGAHPSVTGGDISYLQASLTVNYETGSTALLFCQPGRHTSGSTASICNANGVWNPKLGTCPSMNGAQTCPVLNVRNGTVTYLHSSLQQQYAPGTTAILSCHLGFVVSGASSVRCDDGVWVPAVGSCQSIYGSNSEITQCYEYPAIQNGQVIYLQSSLHTAHAVGSIVTLICDAGYYPSGVTVAQCKDTGKWETLGRCVRIGSSNTAYDQCPELAEAQNGHISYDLVHPRRIGTIAVLICNVGYFPQGTTIIRCEETGQWSSAIGVCNHVFGGSQPILPTLVPIVSQCPVLTVLNGHITYDLINPRSKGTMATLFCNTGYVVNGNAITVCGENGLWNPQLGDCRLIGGDINSSSTQCPPLAVPNGSIVYDLFKPRAIGTSAILSCSLGYLAQGATIVSCQSNGLWSGLLGTCTPVFG